MANSGPSISRAPAASRPCPCCGAPLPAGVTPREELAGYFGSGLFGRIVRRLARRPGLWVETPALVDALYGDDPQGGPITATEIVRKMIFTYRHRLPELGWRIESRMGAPGGYRLVVLPELRDGAGD